MTPRISRMVFLVSCLTLFNPSVLLGQPGGGDVAEWLRLLAEEAAGTEDSLDARFVWRVGTRADSSRFYYDADRHAYDPDYLQPTSWTLYLNACRGPNPSSRQYHWVIRRGLTLEQVISTNKCLVVAGLERGSPRPVSGSGALRADSVFLGRFDLAHDLAWPEEVAPETLPEPLWTDRLFGPGPFRVSLRVTFPDGRTARSGQTVKVADRLVVAIGDSFASGQGNPDESGLAAQPYRDICVEHTTLLYKELSGRDEGLPMDVIPQWVEPAGYRSMRSGFAIAAAELDRGDPSHSYTFLSFANSGAEIRKGLLNPQGLYAVDSEPLSQIEEVRRAVGDRQIDALLLSIGGNDSGFSQIVEHAIRGSFDQSNADARRDFIQDSVPALFAELAAEVRTLNVRQVFISSYPADLIGSRSCGLLEVDIGEAAKWGDWLPGVDGADGVGPRERQRFRDLAAELNRQIALASLQHGWHFVGIEHRFAGRGYCETRSFFRFAQDSCRYQGDFKGTLHPNGRGHRAFADEMLEALERHLR
ncbi:MAG TPA: SGNH/GDSL hydrolase family protein [Longimicrobiales bacterium]|nr:SGNH/GDSL hydrolase family protein [Longimicrobiales bacterium]